MTFMITLGHHSVGKWKWTLLGRMHYFAFHILLPENQNPKIGEMTSIPFKPFLDSKIYIQDGG